MPLLHFHQLLAAVAVAEDAGAEVDTFFRLGEGGGASFRTPLGPIALYTGLYMYPIKIKLPTSTNVRSGQIPAKFPSGTL